MIQDKLQEAVQFAVQTVFGLNLKLKDIEIAKPSSKENGDFATNLAFQLAKELKKSPKEISEALSEVLSKDKSFKKVEAVNGFVNVFLAKENYYDTLNHILSEKENFGNLDLYKGKKVQIEFISANPTGPFTLANGRGGFSGDVLSNIFEKAGAEVDREYYVNDGGNQVRLLGASVLAAAGFIKEEEDFYKGEYIREWAQTHKEEVGAHKDNAFELGQIVAAWILENYNKPSTGKVGIKFDTWFSENQMIERGEVEEAIKKFDEFGRTYKKDDALWMKTTDFGDDKDRVLIKANGEKTYFANDVAYHFDKLYKRKFDLVVNFWGADHHGYVPRMLAAVEAMGCPGKVKIVIFQLVKLIKDGQEFKMSKRRGTYITMDDLLELIGGSTKEAADVARFFFLMRSFSTHMDFDLDLAKERSDKNPVFYVKYAYARLSGILRNAEDQGLVIPAKAGIQEKEAGSLGLRQGMTKEVDLTKLTEEAEMELIDQLSQLPQVINSILTFEGYPVHFLTFYAIDTAKRFHAFYDKCRVIDEEDLETTAARLELVKATKIVLGIVMRDLIGIDAPERM